MNRIPVSMEELEDRAVFYDLHPALAPTIIPAPDDGELHPPRAGEVRTHRWYWEVAHPDGMMTAGWAHTKLGARWAARRHGNTRVILPSV